MDSSDLKIITMLLLRLENLSKPAENNLVKRLLPVMLENMRLQSHALIEIYLAKVRD